MFKNLNPSALGISGHQCEIIELALTYGFSGMDLDAADFASRAKHHGMEYALRLISSAGVRLGQFRLPIEWDVDDDQFKASMAKLPWIAEAAAAAGCTRCIATVAPAGDKRPYHENFEFHKHRFSEICAALAPHGVQFGVSFRAAEYLRKNQAFQFIHDFDALSLLVNMIDSSNMGLVVDIWDIVVGGGSLEAIRGLKAEQIVAVQLADVAAGKTAADVDESSRLLPGAEGGQINAVEVLSILKEKGYEGPVTVMPSRGAFGSRRRDAIVRQTGEALDRAWRGAGLPAAAGRSLLSNTAPAAPAPVAPVAVADANGEGEQSAGEGPSANTESTSTPS